MHASNLKLQPPGLSALRADKRESLVPVISRAPGGEGKQSVMFSPPDSPLVLVVDYRESERRLIAKALLTAGFRVAEAATGDEALAVFLQRQPQIVVLDLLMPFTGGLSACRLLRAQPGGQNLLILMFSGLQDAGTIRRVYDAGASDFLAKPSAASTLRDYAALTSRLLFLWRNWYLTASDRFD